MIRADDAEARPSAASELLDGLRAGVPVIVSAAPFGLLFGAVAVKNGFSPAEAVLMSATVYAGASQMVGIDLFGAGIAPWLVVFSIFAVNFRHVLYSAAAGRRVTAWAPWQRAVGFFFLVDPQYAETEKRAERGRVPSFRWFMAMALPIYVLWILETWIGARFGARLGDPETLGLDFVLPVYFLALLMGFRARPLWLPVVVASGLAAVAAWFTVGSPWHVSIGAAAGILLAAVAPTAPPEPAP